MLFFGNFPEKTLDKSKYKCYTVVQLVKAVMDVQENRFPVGSLAEGVTLSGVTIDKDCIFWALRRILYRKCVRVPKVQSDMQQYRRLISQAKGRSNCYSFPGNSLGLERTLSESCKTVRFFYSHFILIIVYFKSM